MRHLGQRKGAVLIIVLGVLAVLALLATTFATLQATEREIAHNYLDTVRAKLIAQSGIQDGVAQLREYFPHRYFNTVDPKAPKPWKYWGLDETETKEPLPNDKIDDSVNPSFAVETNGKAPESPANPLDKNFRPYTITIEGQKRGFSGVQGGSYASHGDQYVLKVSDVSGRVYLNDGVDGTPQGNQNSVSRNLRRILNELGKEIAIPQLGDKLLDPRPQQGYRSMQDLLKALNYDENLYNRLKNYVTVFAWVDPNVVNPVPLSGQLAQQMESKTGGVRYFRGNTNVYRAGSEVAGQSSDITDPVRPPGGMDVMRGFSDLQRHEIRLWGLDSLNPQWIEVVSRAPINVNAAPEEVLVALLTGLQGFFVTDRKRNNPRWKGDLYLSFKQQSKYGPTDPSQGDEIGFLVETFPIVNSTGTGTQGISAKDIAKEIVACRNADVGKWGNYNVKAGGLWFGGPFKSWHQFNAFVDNLVAKPSAFKKGLLEDRRREIFVDYVEEIDDPTGYGAVIPSDVQLEYASQAIADVIKANFNPNCHLNELNPDANLFLIVDKTDLFINSTEFCFMPTGYFEIESLGRVLRPRNANVKDVYLGDNEIAAQAKVSATFKIYDMYRETTQKQFYGGNYGPTQGGQWGTNNEYTVEIGPEPDNGMFPGNLGDTARPDNEGDGYIALPTMGGVFHGSAPKQKNQLVSTSTLGQTGQAGSAMHVHFTLDHDACQHPVDRREIASGRWKTDGTDEHVSNHPDIVGGTILGYSGPYNPVNGQPNEHRLSKSFRNNPDPKTGTMPSLQLARYAPSDLRIDGSYVERHAAPAYYNLKGGAGIWNFSGEANAKGMVSFWFKPSFSPERTGKVRTMWDMARYHTPCGQDVFVWPFTMWFYPSHYNYALSETQGPKYWHNNQGQFEPASLCWGSKQWHDSSSGSLGGAHEFGRMTACLNHLDHPDHVKIGKPSPLRAHHWINSTVVWYLSGDDGAGTASAKFFVNGTENYTKWSYTSMTGGWAAGHGRMAFFDKHDGGEYNHMRLGGTSRVADAAFTGANVPGAYRGNYTGDHTIDEFYAWNNNSADPTKLWGLGRYYKPTGGGGGGTGGAAKEGRFTSGALTDMVPYSPRVLAPPSSVAPPGGGGGVTGGSMTVEPPSLRILGMSWTWYGEALDPAFTDPAAWDGTPILYDYSGANWGGVPKSTLDIKVGAGIQDGTTDYGPFWDAAYSPILDTNGVTPIIYDPKQVKYFVQFDLKSQLQTILLGTPVIDDVTLFWDDNQSHMLSYVFDNRSF